MVTDRGVPIMLICPPWMGKYPRKGADWSPEEDAALLRAYESGRYLNKEIAARHLREPAAIERRLFKLRSDAWLRRRAQTDQEAAVLAMMSWAAEREAGLQAISKLKEAYAETMWPGERDKTFSEPPRQRGVKPGTLLGGAAPCIVVARPYGIDIVALADLPPEVAQALQFGGEE